MPPDHVHGHPGARTEDRLFASIGQWGDLTPGERSSHLVPALRVIESHRPVVEQAKGALAFRYGIDSHQAFAMMVRWSRTVHAPVHVIAHTLIHGICEGDPQTARRQRPLVRWLEEQLRNNDPEPTHTGRHPGWS